MRIVNLSNPVSPQQVGTFTVGGNAWHIAVAGDIAYFAMDEIIAIDVSDKTNPVLLSAYTTPDGARHSTIANDLLYVSDWAGGLIILGVTERIFLPLIVNP